MTYRSFVSIALAALLAAALAAGSARAVRALAPIATTPMGAHMELTVPTAEAAGDRARADTIVAAARALATHYADVAVAQRDGYVKFLPNVPLPIEHYTSNAYAVEAWEGRFDPQHPTSLVYRRTADGLRMAGVMYTAPNRATADELNAAVPLSVGRWHRHVNFCWPPRGAAPETAAPPRFGFNGTISDRAACDAAGGRFTPVLFGWMVHVWPNETNAAKIWAPHADGDDDHDAMLGSRSFAGLPIARDRLPAAAVAPGDADRGANVFAANCAGCHGALGRNGPDAPVLAGSGLSAGQVAFMVRSPRAVDATSAMPALALSDRDLADVAAYVATRL